MFWRIRYFFSDLRYAVADLLTRRRRGGPPPISEGESAELAPPEPVAEPAAPEPVAEPLPPEPVAVRAEAASPKRRLPRPSLPRPSLKRPALSRPSVTSKPTLKGVGIGLGAILLALFAVYLATDFDFSDEEPDPSAPAQVAPGPRVVITKTAPLTPADLGFPAFATNNTTRVAGADATVDAAGVALAVHPSIGGLEGPAAVSMVPDTDWSAGLVASVLTAAPVGAPVLIAEPGDIPDLTLAAFESLDPAGSPETGGAQVFRVGEVAVPDEVKVEEVAGPDPAALAASVADLRAELTGEPPRNYLLVSSDDPAYAMPAAAWTARSGDPILFVGQDSVPKPTLDQLTSNPKVNVYLLGPEAAISRAVDDQLDAAGVSFERIAGNASDPVESAIEFARYFDGRFGWNINDPGHGLVIASSSRPLDAGAAAPLSASGKWGPLLLIDDAAQLPDELRGYLLDIKPGYTEDPTRAVYNHVWIIGDETAVSVEVQAQIDELAELILVSPGPGTTPLGPEPGTPEGDPDDGPAADSDGDGGAP